MPGLFVYFLKATMLLAFFLAAYHLVLRRLTFHRLNRWFLLLGLVLSAVAPFAGGLFNGLVPRGGVLLPYQSHWVAFPAGGTSAMPAYWRILSILLWSGTALMAVRFLGQLLSVLRIHLESSRAEVFYQRVRRTDRPISPFSFFGCMYINPALHSPGLLRDIVAHERVHIAQWHSIDMLAAELSTVLFWFNPCSWLMKKAVAENLEFICDRRVLEGGADSRHYQRSLVAVGIGPSLVPLGVPFNLVRLKARIGMMNRARSSPYTLLRYLVVVPLACLLMIVSCSRTEPVATLEVSGRQQAGPESTKHSRRAADGPAAAPLYIVDDRVVGADYLDRLNPGSIQSISVFKGPDAVARFGGKGVQGVVVIETRKAKQGGMR